MITEVVSEHFRTDDVNIIIRASQSYINRETLEFVSEIPEGASASDYAVYTGRIRKDQTGEIYEVAHDVEGSDYTYTELFPTPESYSEITIANYGGTYYAHTNYNLYPNYNASNTYAKDDIVVYDKREWISEMDDNTGNTPNLIGWGLYLPYVEEREVEWVTLEELSE